MMRKLQFVSQFENIPVEEKPREKLAKYGPRALDFWELVAIILRVGLRTKGVQENVMNLAKRLIRETGFRGLFTQKSIAAVKENFGLFKSHAEIIVSIAEIVRRMNDRFDVFDASEPVKIFKKFKNLQQKKQEQCYVLCLNEKQKCVIQELIAMGQMNVVRVTPNDILKIPIWLGFKRIILVHNHDDNSKASEADIVFTKKLEKGAFDLHEIKLADHVIIGKDGYFSFKEKGLL